MDKEKIIKDIDCRIKFIIESLQVKYDDFAGFAEKCDETIKNLEAKKQQIIEEGDDE